MTGAGAGALALAAVLTLGACGTTYYDSSVTVPDTGATTTTTLPAVSDATPLPDLLEQIRVLMEHLDEQIVDEQNPQAVMARIDELWVVADAKIRDRDPNDLFPFEQALTYARTGVDRKRPADASKGYRLLLTALASYAP